MTESNICGIDYDMTPPYNLSDRLYFEEWLLMYFDNIIKSEDDITQEDGNLLSIPCDDFTESYISSIFTSIYYAENWYSTLEKFTIPSKLYKLSKKEINDRKFISIPPHGKSFYKLNSYSSKYIGYKPFSEAIVHIFETPRTRDILKNGDIEHYLFVRDFVDMSNFLEFRCFYINYELRGVSIYKGDVEDESQIKTLILKFCKQVNRLLFELYKDFSMDIAICGDNIFIIEINSPVYFNAGSCLFNLNDVRHLLVEKNENFDYPIFKFY